MCAVTEHKPYPPLADLQTASHSGIKDTTRHSTASKGEHVLDEFYRGRTVLITGGLGFIGSNLAIRLVQLGAQVTVIDSGALGCGSNPANLASIAAQVRLIDSDIRQVSKFRSALADTSVVFNLAGEVSHIHSMKYPSRDMEINVIAHLHFLNGIADSVPGVRVVYAGTRQVYGVPRYLPVDESHPIQPVDFNGIHKRAAEQYHDLLTRAGRLDAIVLRLSNVYGPRLATHIPCQGFLAVFLRNLLRNEEVQIYGDGLQTRDPVHVSDVVEAFLIAGRISNPRSRIYNIGGPVALPIIQIAQTFCRSVGTGSPRVQRFPQALKAISIGGFASDCSRAQRELGWSPTISLEKGVQATVSDLRENWAYHQARAASSACLLGTTQYPATAATR